MKRNYSTPTCIAVEIALEKMIAGSDNPGGTIDPMPWGSNQYEGANIWDDIEAQ